MNPKRPLPKVLSEYNPRPGPRFYKKMEDAPWQPQRNPMSHRHTRSFRLGWQFAIAVLLVLAVLSLSIPAVRASLSAWLGLSVAPSNQMPAEAVTLVPVTLPAPTQTLPEPTRASASPTPTPAPRPTSSATKPAAVNQLAAQVSWEVRLPERLPAGYQFQSAYYDSNHQMVIITYLAKRSLPGSSLTSSKTITFLQALKNDFVPMQVAPGAKINDAQVNGQPAAFVVGAWDSEFVKDASDPNGGKMVSTWRNDLAINNLYWQSGKVYLALISDDSAVTLPDLLDIAASAN